MTGGSTRQGLSVGDVCDKGDGPCVKDIYNCDEGRKEVQRRVCGRVVTPVGTGGGDRSERVEKVGNKRNLENNGNYV